jgi:hypothetical protein
MKTLHDFNEALNYVDRLGVLHIQKSPGWIPEWQRRACNLIDGMEALCNGFPFNVRYHRKDDYFDFVVGGVDLNMSTDKLMTKGEK